MFFIITRLLVIIALSQLISGKYKSKFEWQLSELWSSCSKTCGIGVQQNLQFCVKKTLFGTMEKVVSNRCKGLKKINEIFIRSCFLGNCPVNDTSEYIWKTSKWSSCSSSCGGDGIQTRDTQCILALSTGNNLDANDQNCKSNLEPLKRRKCGYFDCPPEFFKTPWKKCSKVRGCQPGIRRRIINCMVTLKNGYSKSVPKGNCYVLSKPPSAWEQCLDDPIYQNKCLFKNTKNNDVPIISVSHSKIHQMRRIKKLKLTIGQTAYVIPHTRLAIKCPVKNYQYQNLLWKRYSDTYKYIGRTKSRILVNPKGYLIIKRFLPIDEGNWTCNAGSVSSYITLRIKTPSEGFSEWLTRNYYFKPDIVFGKNSSTIKYIKSVFNQWVVGQWSVCTRSCGEGGFQNRRVSCEQIESRFFVEVNDDKCILESKTKPDTIRNCVILSKCPAWSIGDLDKQKCTNKCISIGKTIRDLNIICKFENRILPPSSCDIKNRPTETCNDPSCSVFWKTGNWSMCSSSCGSSGLRVRTAGCRWRNDESQAGDLCNQNNSRLPELFEVCHPPPCKLACRDLSKFCGQKKLCRIDHYQYFCCKTCA